MQASPLASVDLDITTCNHEGTRRVVVKGINEAAD